MNKQYITGHVVMQVGEGRKFRVVASTEATDRQGEVIKVNGWDIKNYMNNPVILWAHDIMGLPIGKATAVEKDVENGQLVVEGEFAPEGTHPLADQAQKLYEAEMLQTVSVGFIPVERDGSIITKSELLELSFVPVPANPEALALRKAYNLDACLFAEEAETEKPAPIINSRYNPAKLKALIMEKKEEMPAEESPTEETPAGELGSELSVLGEDIKSVVQEQIDAMIPALETATGAQLAGEQALEDMSKACSDRIEADMEALQANIMESVNEVAKALGEEGEDAIIAEAVVEVTAEVEDAIPAIASDIADAIEETVANIVGSVEESAQAKAEEDVSTVVADAEMKIEEQIAGLLKEAIQDIAELAVMDAMGTAPEKEEESEDIDEDELDIDEEEAE